MEGCLAPGCLHLWVEMCHPHPRSREDLLLVLSADSTQLPAPLGLPLLQSYLAQEMGHITGGGDRDVKLSQPTMTLTPTN